MKNQIRYKSFELREKGKGWWYDEDNVMHVRTKITDETPDLIGDVILRSATEKAMENWVGNIRLQHDSSKPIGKAIKMGEAGGLEWNEVEMIVVPKDVRDLIEAGVLTQTSVGIIPLVYTLRDEEEIDHELSPLAAASWFPPITIESYEFVETSLTDNAMQPAASFSDTSGDDKGKRAVLYRMKDIDVQTLLGDAPAPDKVDQEKEAALDEGNEDVASGDNSYRKEEEEVLPEATDKVAVTEDVGDITPDKEEKDVDTKEQDVETAEDEITPDVVDGDTDAGEEVMELSAAVVLEAIEGLSEKLDGLIESTKGIEAILSKSVEVEAEEESLPEVEAEEAVTLSVDPEMIRAMVKEILAELAVPLPRESSVFIDDGEDDDEIESVDSIHDRKEIHKRMSDVVKARIGDR